MLHHRSRTTPDERGLTTAGIAVIAVIAAGAAGATSYVATDGFGRSSDPSPTAAPTTTASAGSATTTSPSPPVTETPANSPMDRAFGAGKWVVCTYTSEAYDATTTLQSRSVYRIDQQTQGGLAHVISADSSTFVWVEGMTEALELETATYQADPDGRYPIFHSDDFDTVALFDDDTCTAAPPGDEALFDQPDDLVGAASD